MKGGLMSEKAQVMICQCGRIKKFDHWYKVDEMKKKDLELLIKSRQNFDFIDGVCLWCRLNNFFQKQKKIG